MHKLIIFKEKHGDRHFSFHNQTDLELVAAFIVRERTDDGWYCDTENEDQLYYLKKFVGGDERAAVKLLYARERYEYEGFEIVEPEIVKGVKS